MTIIDLDATGRLMARKRPTTPLQESPVTKRRREGANASPDNSNFFVQISTKKKSHAVSNLKFDERMVHPKSFMKYTSNQSSNDDYKVKKSSNSEKRINLLHQ